MLFLIQKKGINIKISNWFINNGKALLENNGKKFYFKTLNHDQLAKIEEKSQFFTN